MAINYIKFQRGSKAAYEALVKAGRIDKDTLYFIYPEENESLGALYMGNRLISGGDVLLESAYLDDLKDVVAANAETNSFLVRDGENWVAKTLDDVVNLISNYLDINVDFNENQFVLDDLKVVNLLGFKEAEVGANLVKGSDGKVSWVKPDTTAFDDLASDVRDLTSQLNGLSETVDSKADKESVYTKEETDTAIGQAITNAAHLKREIFTSKVAAENAMSDYGEAAGQYIYMVARPKESILENDHYDEYMAFKDADGWHLEKVGDWGVDLSDYAKVTEVAELLNGKVDKVEGSRLITTEEARKLEKLSIDEEGNVGISGTVSAANVQELYNAVVNITTGTGTGKYDNEDKTLLGIQPGAQINVIDSVDETELVIDENKKLGIKQIAASKVIDLAGLLNEKADKTTVDALDDRVAALEGMMIWVEMEEPMN